MRLLTDNTKLRKPVNGYKMTGLQLAPANTSGYNVCQYHTEECKKYCVAGIGFGQLHSVQDARINRTNYFFQDRKEFIKQLHRELDNFAKTCKKKQLKPAVRLNIFSDLPWEKIDATLFNKDIEFYDYTKDTSRALLSLNTKAQFPRNYKLTFSWSGENAIDCMHVLNRGGNVAVPFQELPDTFMKYKVINGDKHDLRLPSVDGENVIVGLVAKGGLKKNDSVFKVTLPMI